MAHLGPTPDSVQNMAFGDFVQVFRLTVRLGVAERGFWMGASLRLAKERSSDLSFTGERGKGGNHKMSTNKETFFLLFF